ncbi:beta-N-acetylglucosaminidase domain-containing protein [Streptomyces sp. NPDC020681]|uniref:beta-N-acetylglucosaminidase domain-containing protein n=1 Tax=Streptomyces sp. NPDC020681 TaxID=3365083 RepID=UPI0037AE1206
MAIGSTTAALRPPWRPRGAHVVALALSLLIPADTAAAAAVHPVAGNPKRSPQVFPKPRSLKSRTDSVRIPSAVTLVAGADTDAAALTVVRSVLRDAGVRTIEQVDDHTPVRGGRFVVHVGGHKENAATNDALSALGVQGAEMMAAEGYVLAVGEGRDGRDHIVLSGVDTAGTYYAAQTLRQLVHGPRLRGVVIRDWPSLRRRGVVEGFYGPPWSHRQRLADLDWFGRHKMNFYVYTPKDDPYLRAEWRKPYPAADLARIGELVRRARANHVEFGHVLSPGLSVCYSKPSEADALTAKFESLWALGVRSFVVAFDDIDYQRWNCDEDREIFGTGPAAAAGAQAHLTNAVQKAFIAEHPEAEPLQMVPTQYWGSDSTDYTRRLAQELDPEVVVQWTGVDVIAPRITRADVAAAREVFGHPVLLWDNYPVNDYVQGRLLLGPFTGREAGLGESAIGLTANPMPQAQASKTSLFGVADYAWNDAAYDPERAWAAGLDELAGGDEGTAEALRAFASVHYSSRLDPRPAPELAARIEEFRRTGRAAPLYRALRAVHESPSRLRDRLEDPGFLTETGPWLDATEAWGRAALTALDMLTAQRAGHGAEAWAARQSLPLLIAKAKSFTWVGLDPNRRVPVELDPVMEEFVRCALEENTRWLGLSQPSPVTNLPPLDGRFPASHMTDGDPGTYFWGAAAAGACRLDQAGSVSGVWCRGSQGGGGRHGGAMPTDDNAARRGARAREPGKIQPTGPGPGHVAGVDLGRPRPVTDVEVAMGKSGSPDDYIHEGVVEYSADGSTWKQGPAFAGEATVRAELPAGAVARYVRLRATRAQENWVAVREFTVGRGDAVTVSGTPAPAAGSGFALAADENAGTAYEAATAPSSGDALTAALPGARELRRVLVLQPGTDTADGMVQVHTAKGWATLGPLSGRGLTELPARGLTADAVRVRWAEGRRAPQVSEILPVYADAAPASVAFAPANATLDTGGSAAVTATLTSTRSEDQRLTVEADPPQGLTVEPARRELSLPRGGRTEIKLRLRAAENLATGTYRIPVTVRGKHGTPPATTTLTVTVWPRTSAANVALATAGASADASQVEDDAPQFAAAKAIDGEHWTTAATVTDSPGGTESVRLDAPGTRFVRMQGLGRASGFGCSVYEFEVNAVAENGE